ncbi:hypothetical protein GF367_01710 [Candidatus Woesearchaeota archaeon]|nr:hypothetical protein [Candidatus Woesearchaeota archaeon]
MTTKRGSFGRLSRVEQGVKDAFAKVRDELDMHLDTINENTVELRSVYDLLAGLEQKVEKLAERVDELQLSRRRYAVDPLSLAEQEVFLLLYTASLPVALPLLVERLGMSEQGVFRLVHSLSAKGVPVLEQVHDGVVSFALEVRFKEAQARQQVVPLDRRVSMQAF